MADGDNNIILHFNEVYQNQFITLKNSGVKLSIHKAIIEIRSPLFLKDLENNYEKNFGNLFDETISYFLNFIKGKRD